MTIQALKGGKPGPVAPTVGFRNDEIRFAGRNIKLYDLGGSKSFRGVWQHYVHEVHGMIYVIDSADFKRLDETKEAFQTIISNERFVGKPVLILANKQDLPSALALQNISERTETRKFATKSNCPSHIEPCSAIKGSGRAMDKHLKAGLQWLCRVIMDDITALNERRETDIEEVRVIRDREKAEMRARVMAIREQREKEEAAERRRLGEELACEGPGDEDIMDGSSPFKPLDMNSIIKKEAAEKAKKKKKKEAETAKKATEIHENSHPPKTDTNSSNIRVIKIHQNDNLNMDDTDYSDDADIIVPSKPKTVKPADFTPIENDNLSLRLRNLPQLPKIDLKSRRHLETTQSVDSYLKDRHKRKKKSPNRENSDVELDTPRDMEEKHIRFGNKTAINQNLVDKRSIGDYNPTIHDDLFNIAEEISSPEIISPKSGKKRKSKLTPRSKHNSMMNDMPLNEISGNMSIGTLSKVILSPATSDLNTSMSEKLNRSGNTLSRSENEGSDEETPPTSVRAHRYLKPVAKDEAPHEANKKRRKRKKSRARRNQLTPSDDDLPIVSTALARPLPPLPWQLNDTLRFPKDDKDSGNESVHHNWAFVDDLPDASTPSPRSHKPRPNYEGGDDIFT